MKSPGKARAGRKGLRRRAPGGKRGTPPLVVTAEQRQQVEALAGLGLKIVEISGVVGIAERSLYTHCRVELSRGLVKADAAVMNNLYKIATSNTPQAAGAAIFWAKCRRRWHEIQRVIHGFDPESINLFVKQVVDVLRRFVPDTCPHCKTKLELKPKIAEELRELSKRMTERLPPSEIVPIAIEPEPLY